MTRIPDDELERIKRDVSVERLALARGVKLTGHGDNLTGLCPFHDDRTPSLVISPSKNIWHCLGACQAGGSVIDWVMRAEGASFRLAVEMLRKASPSLAAERPTPATRPKLEPLADVGESDAVVLGRVVEHYHATLRSSREAQDYLTKRGLDHAEMIAHFKLGYSNRTLGYRLPTKAISEGAALREQLQRLGVYRSTGHEHFAGSLVVPVIDETGAVREIYGRKIRDDLRPGTPAHLYLPSGRDGRGVFNLAGLRGEREIVLCESLIDALTIWAAGQRAVTTAYGVEGFTDELRSAILELGVGRVLVAYDRDDAGDRGAEKVARELGAAGLEVFRVYFPRGMDANEYALSVQPATKAIETAIRGARRMAGTVPVSVPDEITPTISTAEALEVLTAAPPISTAEAPEPIAALPDPSLVADGASSGPPAIAPSLSGAELTDDELRVTLGDRAWRIRGLAQRTTYDSLRVNVQVRRGEAFFLDTVELNLSRQRAAFVRDAACELKVEEATMKSDVAKIVVYLESVIESRIAALTKPSRPELTAAERDEALALLRDPNLRHRILADFDRVGIVGEEINKLLGYLAATSRKLESPLAVVIQSSSAAGKSSLMDAILRFMPEEERVQYSAMTGQSLYYMGETNLRHKILAIAEEHGAQSASYALKLLQSDGELRIASTGKDESGELRTRDRHVEGPVMLFMTTTAVDVDEELLNRCLILTVDECAAQTSAIQARQRSRQSLEGLLARRERDVCLRVHQNAQRLLEPLAVVNDLAGDLRFVSHTPRTRRDHMKYLTLIQAITLLYQHQREVKEVRHRGESVRYIEVQPQDIALADELLKTTMRQCLDDLPPQTRRLLEEITSMVTRRASSEGIERSAVRFTRRDVREATGFAQTQLKMHMHRLEELEYLAVHGGGARRRMTYELAYDVQLVGVERIWSGPGRPLVGGFEGQISDEKRSAKSKLVGLSEGAREPLSLKRSSSYLNGHVGT